MQPLQPTLLHAPLFQNMPLKADGFVLTYFSDFYTVKHRDGRRLTCKRKALLKKQGMSVRVGDWVTLDVHDNDLAWITGVLPPQQILNKPSIHNISHVLVVCPWQEPSLDLRQVDRLLSKVQLAQLNPVLVITKADIHPEKTEGPYRLDEWQAYYQQVVGVPTLTTSIYNPSSIEALQQTLLAKGATWVVAGVSGAGKSSLLNILDPQLKLKVDAVSAKGGRGTHTTRHTELLETAQGLFIADTPGFSQLDFSQESPLHLAATFPEFDAFTTNSPCAYEDCLHLQEADCRLLHALESGHLQSSRYQHYREMVSEAKAGEENRFLQSQKQESTTKLGKSKKGGKPIHVVKLDAEQRQENRKASRQHLKQIEQQIQQQQRHHTLDELDEREGDDF